jgi:hypothetical protein
MGCSAIASEATGVGNSDQRRVHRSESARWQNPSMAGQKAGFAHVVDVGVWISASPRVQAAVAAVLGIVLASGLMTVVAHRPGTLREPVALAAAVGPVEQVVVDPSGKGSVSRPAAVPVSRSKTARRPSRTTTTTPPAKAVHERPVSRTDWAYLGPRIRGCESGSGPDTLPDYTAENPDTSASGAYQIIDSTWAGRYGVDHASDATPEQQEAAALDLFRRHGTADWAASASCWR